MREIMLEQRMNTYRDATNYKLPPRVHSVVELRGQSYRTFCRNFNTPFDDDVITCMNETMKYICNSIRGCIFGYTYGDTIMLLISEYQPMNQLPWMNNDIQKIDSVLASKATLKFNQLIHDAMVKKGVTDRSPVMLFDAHVFSVPKVDVVNYFIYQQNACFNMALLNIAHKEYEHSKIVEMSSKELKDALKDEKGIDFETYTEKYKFGYSIRKVAKKVEVQDRDNPDQTIEVYKSYWEDLRVAPSFALDREYIYSLFKKGE